MRYRFCEKNHAHESLTCAMRSELLKYTCILSLTWSKRSSFQYTRAQNLKPLPSPPAGNCQTRCSRGCSTAAIFSIVPMVTPLATTQLVVAQSACDTAICRVPSHALSPLLSHPQTQGTSVVAGKPSKLMERYMRESPKTYCATFSYMNLQYVPCHPGPRAVGQTQI